MKVLSYNISWSKQFKIDRLFNNKGIDAFVVPECANNDNIVVPDNFQFLSLIHISEPTRH